jgi:hypothetical protein
MPIWIGQSIWWMLQHWDQSDTQKKYTQLISAQGVKCKVNTYEHG